MSQTKNFTAEAIPGTTGYFIHVEGEVNCGKLDVEPTLKKRQLGGTVESALLLDVYPASDDPGGSFRKAAYNENIDSENTYTEVQLIDPSGEKIANIPVTKVQSEKPANK